MVNAPFLLLADVMLYAPREFISFHPRKKNLRVHIQYLYITADDDTKGSQAHCLRHAKCEIFHTCDGTRSVQKKINNLKFVFFLFASHSSSEA